MRHVMIKECDIKLFNVVAADDDEGVEGPVGTAPKTVEPLEFVVFNTDELVLQFQFKP